MVHNSDNVQHITRLNQKEMIVRFLAETIQQI